MKNLKNIRLENNEQEKLLFSCNQDVLYELLIYLRTSDLEDYEVESIRKDLIGMAIESQLKDEYFKDIIGEDIKEFCDDLISIGDKKSNFKKVVEVLQVVSLVSIVMFVLEVFFS